MADRNGDDAVGCRSPSQLAELILARIRDRDFPAGTELGPVALGLVLSSAPARIAEALEQLEGAGATVRVGDVWMVRHDRAQSPRELIARAQPLLLAIARMAAERGTPAQAATIAAAGDRLAGLSGDGTITTRIAAYDRMLMLIAEAAGSRFHEDALEQLLEEAVPLMAPIMRRQLALFPEPDPNHSLVRLARALMAGNPAAAEHAMEDHLILISRHMDWISGD